jgi:prepilin signal peptidase PulO-like enzyme (type II secretory pathway)
MLSNKWNMIDNVYYHSRLNDSAKADQNCQSFVVPVSCCLKCKQPLKWTEEKSLFNSFSMVTYSVCCGHRYEWDSLTLIRPIKVFAVSYDEALSKVYSH